MRIASRLERAAQPPVRLGCAWEIAYKSAFNVTQSRITTEVSKRLGIRSNNSNNITPLQVHRPARATTLSNLSKPTRGIVASQAFKQQAQPQAVYVQQPPPQKDSGFCAACLTGVCLCCCAEGAWCFGYVLRLLWAYEIAQTPRQSFASAFAEASTLPPSPPPVSLLYDN
ncbi:hypothetical protein EDB83DRAFT_2550279 [Lactarius deliciosus]|nr:hypothetical protein EDB83DRAFT_2550279 [Lactarius deliciosus]